jgi:thiosulfate/3-mercaptopyruvate sulfurtransferase
MVIAMKLSKSRSWLLIVFVSSLLLLALVYGTSIQKEDSSVSKPINSIDLVSGNPVDKDIPTAIYNGYAIGFCCETSRSDWEEMSKIEKDALVRKFIDESSERFVEKSNATSGRSDEFKRMLVPIADVSSSDLLLDISENSTKHIADSIIIPYTDFLDDGSLVKSVPDLARILGSAGISRNDSIVVYGECMPCGGGPATATFVYWIMKCLGHENVRVLDGTIEDWAAAGLPTTNGKSAIRPYTNYTPMLVSEFSALYDYVKSGNATIVDARPFHEFNASSIPGAINIPYDDVVYNSTIKNETALRDVFANLTKDEPVVVFTNTGIKASVVWFALEMLGYDAKLYSWENWLANEA